MSSSWQSKTNRSVRGFWRSYSECAAVQAIQAHNDVIANCRKQRRNCRNQILTLLSALKQCSLSRDLEGGKRLHSSAAENGLDSDKFIASTLVTMYARCCCISEARSVFDTIPHSYRDVVLWNSLLLGYVENEQAEAALDLFRQMQESENRCGLTPRTFVAVLKACTQMAAKEVGNDLDDGKTSKVNSLQLGRGIHSLVLQGTSDLFVASALVNMYARCGSLIDARMVFDRMPLHDIIPWGSLMLGYADNGEEDLALEFFSNLRSRGKAADATVFVAAIKACGSLAVKEEGREVDGKVVKLSSLEKGVAVHSQAADAGLAINLFVASTLVDMYAKCRSMVNAQRVFDKMPCHNLISWTSLMLGYTEIDDGDKALGLFSRMQQLTSTPDAAAFVSALKACISLSAKEEAQEQVDGKFIKVESLKKGIEIHSQVMKSGCEAEVSVGISLVDMYAKCGSLTEARKVFDRMAVPGIVSWTALTLGYAENGEGEIALELFSQANCELDSTAFLAILKACTSLAMKESGEEIDGKLVKVKSLRKGMSFHALAAKNGFDTNSFVATSLVDLYGKCGSMVDARGVFDRTTTKTSSSWNALLLGYCENGDEELALELAACMTKGEENSRTFVIVLKACGALVALETAKLVHGSICRCGAEVDAVITACLVDVYGKCGSMAEAQQVFDSSSSSARDLVTWTALIAGYSRIGDSRRVFQVFGAMEKEGLQANEVTLVCLLTACSHAGLVELGKKYYAEMFVRFGVEAGVEHCLCVVDLLGRANQLDAAVEFVENMPHEPSVVTWMTILGACWKWKNVRVGKLAFDRLVKLDDKHPAAYDLMANIYGISNTREDQSRIQICEKTTELLVSRSLVTSTRLAYP